MNSLRPYQVQAIQAAKERWAVGKTRQLIVLPTGMGKSVVFSNLARELGITKKVLVLAHREELLEQAADKYARWNPGTTIGIEKAERRAGNVDVVVASVQSLRKGSSRLSSLNPDEFGLVISDEVHRGVADSYISIYEHFGLLKDGNHILHTGFTATPNRHDGRGLQELFSDISYSMDILTCIKDGWLSNLRAFKVTTGQSLEGIKSRAGDFAVDELAQAVNNSPRNEIIVKHWKELCENRTTLGFCADVSHAKTLAACFQEHGISAEAVWGEDPLRSEKISDLANGKIKVLFSCALLTEGYDEWRIGAIIMARPTKSQLLFVQCIGRGTRIPEGINNLLEARAAGVKLAKEDCIVLDVVDSCRNSLVTLPTLFGLGERLDMKGKDILTALKRVEEIEEAHPQADLKDAPDLDTLASYATSIDLFTIQWANEVLEGSTMQWHRAPDGHYVLRTKERRIEVFEDLLQKWNVKVTMGEKVGVKGDLRDLPEAFSYAESYVRDRCPTEVTLVKREARWHKEKASEAQILLLKKFRVPIMPGLTKGGAQLALKRLLKKG